MKISVYCVDSVAGEIEARERQIAARAEELHDHGGQNALDDWLAAERETFWRPAIEVQEHDNGYVVEAAVAGVEPGDLHIRMAPHDVVIEANVHHRHEHTGDALLCEFATGSLFRSYHFAHPVDPAHTRAQYRNGLLRITAPFARRTT
ncbi:MAG: Hsp20/alpha crystallin family protein [Acidobacteria bacterium]|nr:Hsp20/alpha crystallin family protein [Acidobacteriota bacterium]